MNENRNQYNHWQTKWVKELFKVLRLEEILVKTQILNGPLYTKTDKLFVCLFVFWCVGWVEEYVVTKQTHISYHIRYNMYVCLDTNLRNKGLISWGRDTKVAPPITIPRPLVKSSIRDLSPKIFGVMFQDALRRPLRETQCALIL